MVIGHAVSLWEEEAHTAGKKTQVSTNHGQNAHTQQQTQVGSSYTHIYNEVRAEGGRQGRR